MNDELLKWTVLILLVASMICGFVLSRKVTTLRAGLLAHLPLLAGAVAFAIAVLTHSLAASVAFLCLASFWFFLVRTFYGALIEAGLNEILRFRLRRRTALGPRPDKEQALAELEERRRDRKDKQEEDPEFQHVYCESCGHIADVVSKDRFAVPLRLCPPCDDLKTWGWLR
jgi:hypothetical protein